MAAGPWHEDVVVVKARHHIGADPAIGQRAGEGSGQTDSGKVRMNGQADACPFGPRINPGGLQGGVGGDDGRAFILGHGGKGVGDGGFGDGIAIRDGVQDRLHGGQQLLQVGDCRHGILGFWLG